MAEFEIIATAVLTDLGAGATKVAMVPWEEAADRFRNRIRGVGMKAEVKSGGRPIQFNERVGFKALSEAAFNDDEIVSDYLGGILAASGPDDDAGAAVVAVIGRLSALELRVHYVVYRELRRLWPPGIPMNLYVEQEARKTRLRIPQQDLIAAIGAEKLPRLGSAVTALVRERLLGLEYSFSNEKIGDIDVRTLRVEPSGLGAELFLWGHGAQPIQANRLFDPGLSLEFLTDVSATPTSSLVSPPSVPEDAAGS